MAKSKQTSRLGRGLSSLMAQSVDVQNAPPKDAGQQLHWLPVNELQPNPHQPRQHFDEAALQRLAQSIEREGLMQPIVVRPAEEGYELVAGERRWRAARLANLDTVPAIVRPLDDQQLAEWALIENLQREDLNPIERAEAFQRLADQFHLSHDEIAERVGLNRSTISNLLRLLDLADAVKQLVREGTLSMGQARAIAGLSDPAQQESLAWRAVQRNLSVRQVEQLVRQTQEGGPTSGDHKASQVAAPGRAAYLADLEQQIAEQLNTRVHIRAGRKKGSGSLTIEFYSLDEFDALLERLGVSTT